MLRAETPCDFGPCPYEAEYGCTCAMYCSVEEPEEDYEEEYEQEWEDPDIDEEGFDPYEGCYTYDC